MCTVAEGAMMVFVRCVLPTKCRRGSEGKSDYQSQWKNMFNDEHKCKSRAVVGT